LGDQKTQFFPKLFCELDAINLALLESHHIAAEQSFEAAG
jgi:hypothetical protein